MDLSFNTSLPVAIGTEHAGFEYKAGIIAVMREMGFVPDDKGTHSAESTEYPDYAHAVASMVERGESDAGILICGSGNGVAMTANKHAGIRAALCWNPELAALARQHNGANVLCIPARFVSEEVAADMVRAFLSTDFEGGRHQRRAQKIDIGE